MIIFKGKFMTKLVHVIHNTIWKLKNVQIHKILKRKLKKKMDKQ